MGPTASGKTALAIALRKVLPVELISVDSALIYRGMDIGTAKPDAAELSAAPHRLLDILDPAEAYSAADFRRDALAEMADIVAEYEKFSRRWNTANKLINCDEAFRRDANVVLRKVHERMQREDNNFYPLVEQL